MIQVPDNRLLRVHPEDGKYNAQEHSYKRQLSVFDSLKRFKGSIITTYPIYIKRVNKVNLAWYTQSDRLVYLTQEEFITIISGFMGYIEIKLCVRVCNYAFIMRQVQSCYGDIDVDEVCNNG